MQNGSEGEGTDGISKAFLDVELKGLNSSLPKVRRTLSELLSDASPSYFTAAGDNVRFDKSELLSLSKLVPPDQQGEIRLPLVIIKEAGSKRGVYTVDGNERELSLLANLLGKDMPGKHMFRPEVHELGKHYPSIFVLGFSF